MKRTQNNNFPTVHTEGILLPPDILARIAEPKSGLEGLAPADYHLPEGERINEAVNRSWNRLLPLWANFQTALKELPENDAAVGVTRDRWLLPLFQELGYGRLQRHKAVSIENKTYPISHIWENLPIHLVGARIDMDKRTPGQAGAAQASPHSLVQEFLNRSDVHLWAFLSNGLKLRVLRDNLSLVRQAYVEFDLEAMMDGELYSDFRLLWLLCHQSRVEGERPELCWLEKWTQEARQQGARALDQLREGVETAISALGSGFLSHPANRELLDKLADGNLDAQDYYRQLLRLVYRLIFLFVAEDRDLLLDPQAPESARDNYREFYSTRRLRQLAGRLRGGRHDDLFESLKVVMQRLYEQGSPELALPALGSFLWAPEKIRDLEGLRIRNRDFLEAVRCLAFAKHDHALRPIDYRNLGSEELGSVYESLLELHPELHKEAGTFELKTAAGHERKTTGSYYTPASLINELLNSALDPVLNEAAAKENPEQAILNLKVCDPAAGSGHFLVAAAHRIARRLASVRTGDEEPAPAELNHALRDVVGHCLYGVDINEMAVELCKVSLWMTGMERGRPLSFLDHRIRCGNSLLGTTPALMARGIPDEAFNPITGDDKEYCTKYKKQNKKERESRMLDMFGQEEPTHEEYCKLREAVSRINALADGDVMGVKEQAAVYEAVMKSDECKYSHLVADVWCAAFVWKKNEETGSQYPITEAVFRKIESEPHKCPIWMKDEIHLLAEQYQFFHWNLEFPDVFVLPRDGEKPEYTQMGWSGGFDVVLGNPPWDKIQPEETKFFASIRPDIATAKGSRRKALIRELQEQDHTIYVAWDEYKRHIDGMSQMVKAGGLLTLTSRGNLNSYRLFAELDGKIINPNGYAGVVVQTGLATDETSRHFLASMMELGRIRRFLDFENRQKYFPDVDIRFRFALFTQSGFARNENSNPTIFGWLLRSLDEIKQEGRLVSLSIDDLRLFNPNTETAPVFSSTRDLEINRVMYKAGRHIYCSTKNRFSRIDFQGELFNMTRDSRHFMSSDDCKSKQCLPLYEAKYMHHYDHRYASQNGGVINDCTVEDKNSAAFTITTRYYTEESEVYYRAKKQGIKSNWMVGFRSVSSGTNERTAIMSLLPFSGIGNSINLVLGLDSQEVCSLLANVNSFAFDYACRQKMSGMNLNIWIFKQLPLIPVDRALELSIWAKGKYMEWLSSRVLELSFTGWDLSPFAADCGYAGPPFYWDVSRRFIIRCELDAAFFHLYDIGRDDAAYIMDTFPIVEKNDIQKYQDYRTKLMILDIYDKMKTAMETGEPYQTILDPPPTDPSVAHSIRT